MKDADAILTYVTNLKIQIDEFEWWANDLKKPLAIVADETARRYTLREKEAGFPKDHNNKNFIRRMQYARKKTTARVDAINTRKATK